MIISRNWGQKLVRDGKAEIVSFGHFAYNSPCTRPYVVINRFDLQRTDCYPASAIEEAKYGGIGWV